MGSQPCCLFDFMWCPGVFSISGKAIKIEIVCTAVATDLLEGAGTGACPEGSTMDLLKPRICPPGEGLQMTRKNAVPCARAVTGRNGWAWKFWIMKIHEHPWNWNLLVLSNIWVFLWIRNISIRFWQQLLVSMSQSRCGVIPKRMVCLAAVPRVPLKRLKSFTLQLGYVFSCVPFFTIEIMTKNKVIESC